MPHASPMLGYAPIDRCAQRTRPAAL